jgi:hypothetical protein
MIFLYISPLFIFFIGYLWDIYGTFQIFPVPGERALQQDEPRAATIKVISPTAKVPLLEKTTT